MTDFFTRQLHKAVSGALAPVEAAGTRLLAMVAIAGVAIVCLIAAIAFLSVALDQWLAQLEGPVIAALGAAGLYLVIAVICVVVLRARNATKAKSKMKAKIPPPSQPVAPSPVAATIEDTLAPLVAILHDTGLKREEVAVRLGAEVAKQLGPVALVVTALAAGFILERSLLDSKKPPR